MQHSTVTWRERMTFDVVTTTGHELTLDAAPPSGDDRGPKPIELLLSALAGCTAMDVLSILQKKREPVQGLQVYVEGTRAAEHPMIYTDITVVYRVCGDVKPDSVARAIELSETKYCGAAAMLGKSAHITTRYEIVSRLPCSQEPASPLEHNLPLMHFTSKN
jgi:putative redox protein